MALLSGEGISTGLFRGLQSFSAGSSIPSKRVFNDIDDLSKNGIYVSTFQKLQKAGKVKHLGLSNETPWGVMKFLEIARRE